MSLEMQALLKALGDQTAAINEQTAAINRLVQTTAALIEALAAQDDFDGDGDVDAPRPHYLDGSLIGR